MKTIVRFTDILRACLGLTDLDIKDDDHTCPGTTLGPGACTYPQNNPPIKYTWRFSASQIQRRKMNTKKSDVKTAIQELGSKLEQNHNDLDSRMANGFAQLAEKADKLLNPKEK